MPGRNRLRSRSLFGSFDDAAPAMLERVAQGESFESVASSMATSLATTPAALERRLRRRRERLDESDHPILNMRRAVSVENEQVLLGLIKAFATANQALRKDEVVAAVRSLAQDSELDARHWVDRFLERQKRLITCRKDKTITLSRMRPGIIDDVDHYIAGYEALRETHPVSDHGVMSLDEFLLSFCNGDLGELCIEWVKRNQKVVLALRAKRIGSICYVTSARGFIVAKFVILRTGNVADKKETATVVLPEMRRLQRWQTTNTWYIAAPNGMMDNLIFSLIADKLVELKESGLDHIGPGLDRHLKFDGLVSHRELPTLSKLIEHKIYPVILPPNTSHFTAVEDNALFGVLRSGLNHGTAMSLGEATTIESQTAVIWKALEVAESAAASQNAIRASYRNVGAVPWSPDLIRLRARRALGLVLPHSSAEPTHVHDAALAAKQVIDRRVASAAVASTTGKAIVKKGKRRFETVEEQFERYEKEAEEKARETEEKEKKKAAKFAKKEKAKLEKEELARAKVAARVAKREKKEVEQGERKRRRAESTPEAVYERWASTHCAICTDKWDSTKELLWIGCSSCPHFCVCDKHEFARVIVRDHETMRHGDGTHVV